VETKHTNLSAKQTNYRAPVHNSAHSRTDTEPNFKKEICDVCKHET